MVKILLTLVVGGLAAATWAKLPVDEVNGVGGIRFGQRADDVLGFKQQFQVRSRRMRTRLYQRAGDTAQLCGLGAPANYWFRAGRFIGIDKDLVSPQRIAEARVLFTSCFGPPESDTLGRVQEWYWLGPHSYVLLSNYGNSTGTLNVGNLSMLNEYAVETAVRAAARQRLGWRPDSIGLPPQRPPLH